MGTQYKVFNAEVMENQLRKLRNSTGMNQENFAEKLNLSKDTISNYERGVTSIPHDVITILCQKLNVSADFFYFEIDKPLVEDGNIANAFIKELEECSEFEKKQLMEMLKILRMQPVAV
ncbi:helix-turn-helix domain-containing protein [Oscillospiraceae bacterium LCP25S3_E10]